ncbi:MAG: calcineurin-like phosphoesterase family protein [Polyangiales bacterium]
MSPRQASVRGALWVLALGVPAAAEAKDLTYRGAVEVQRASEEDACKAESCSLSGFVFDDVNRDGKRQPSEHGVAGVAVSNGEDVVRTDSRGHYTLMIRKQLGGTTVFITKPAAYEVPLDRQNLPQFFYHHLPEGSPKLRFGGLAPTGPLPKAVNFPLSHAGVKDAFRIVVSGDTQPYSNNEVGYVRDTLAEELAALDADEIELTLIEGDVMGDDLGLFPRFKEVMRISGAPLYLVPGNHDLDLDAKDDTHSLDTFKREFGPSYYSFDVGKVHFVVLDDMKYPCKPDEDNADGKHPFCGDPVRSPTYNGVISERQLAWLANDVAEVPSDRLIVLNQHIPLVSYIDQGSAQHQVDNVRLLYQLLAERQVLSFAGHTHTLEQMRPGDLFSGWNTALTTPIGATPFHQIIAGAACGGWWSGDFDADGVPMAWDKLGSPRGYLVVDFMGASYQERFKATGKAPTEQMSLSFLSPSFQRWYDSLVAWIEQPADKRSAVPPVSINDLPDPSILTASDRAGGSFLVANVWNGSTDSKVSVRFDDGPEIALTQTQQASGEGIVKALDPYALERQLAVLRYAIRSESGDPRAQGFEQFRGSQRVGPPQPMGRGDLADRSSHLWTVPVPQGLSDGAHKAKVTTVDAYGRVYSSVIAFEVMNERPAPFFRKEVFE